MLRRKGLGFLLASVIAAAIFSVVSVRFVRAYTHTVYAVVAVGEIQAYSAISESDVKLQEVPLAALTSDAITDLGGVVGHYAQERILPGDILRRGRLADVQGDRVLTAQLTHLGDKTLRAVALAYDPASAAGGQVRPGDRVDILASVKIDAAQNLSVGLGKIIAVGVPVLRVDEVKGTSAGTVTLAMTPKDAEALALARVSGQLSLAVNPYDADLSAAADTPGVTGQSWLQRYGFVNGPDQAPDKSQR